MKIAMIGTGYVGLVPGVVLVFRPFCSLAKVYHGFISGC